MQWIALLCNAQVLTITQIDENANLISGFDGLAIPREGDLKPPSISISMHEMLKMRGMQCLYLCLKLYYS